MKRIRRILQSLLSRLVMTHVLVVTVTTILINLGALLLVGLVFQSLRPDQYRDMTMDAYNAWRAGKVEFPDYPHENVFMTPGIGLVVSKDEEILLARGDTICQTGMTLNQCAPELMSLSPGARFYDVGGRQYVEVVIIMPARDRVILRMATIRAVDIFSSNVPGVPGSVTGIIPYMLAASLVTGLLSLPVALIVVWLTVRPLARRISRIASASQHFAAGELSVRVEDKRQDEVGRLAQQFDSMADTLQQNVYVLRDLAQRNAALTHQAEQLAIQTERARLSRDLHDAIAQRLFSLTVSTSTLPNVIQENQQRGVEQAQSIAGLAEQTLLDLRTLIVELRPAGITQHGFASWLRTFCAEWEAAQRTPLELSMMLSGDYLPGGIESTFYYIVQEALSNIARHARATAVSVSLVEGRQQIVLSITDNGVGFPSNGTNGHGKFGLMNMNERATAAGGSLAIESDTARGCTIRVTLPLRQPEAAAPEKTQ